MAGFLAALAAAFKLLLSPWGERPLDPGLEPAPVASDAPAAPSAEPDAAPQLQPGDPGSTHPERAEPPAAQPATTPEAAAQPGTPQSPVDDLLNALEAAGQDLRTLTAEVRYTKSFALEGDEQTRLGVLTYLAEPGDPPRRKFGVRWTELRVDDRRDTDYRHAYIFDGEWLVERLEREGQKQFIKRQVVKPGTSFDPLRLGEGPFPVPIGQSREDILARFEAACPELTEGLFDETLIQVVRAKPTRQLHLTPRPHFEAEMNLAEIRIWYRDDTMLPVLAWTRTSEGNEATVLLMRVKTNEIVPGDVLDTTTPAPGTGWDVEVSEYRGDVGGLP